MAIFVNNVSWSSNYEFGNRFTPRTGFGAVVWIDELDWTDNNPVFQSDSVGVGRLLLAGIDMRDSTLFPNLPQKPPSTTISHRQLTANWISSLCSFSSSSFSSLRCMWQLNWYQVPRCRWLDRCKHLNWRMSMTGIDLEDHRGAGLQRRRNQRRNILSINKDHRLIDDWNSELVIQIESGQQAKW